MSVSGVRYIVNGENWTSACSEKTEKSTLFLFFLPPLTDECLYSETTDAFMM